MTFKHGQAAPGAREAVDDAATDWLTGKRKGHGMKYRRKEIVEAIQYQGFDINGRECEVFAGDQFNSHIPSKGIIELANGEQVLAGEWLVRDEYGDVCGFDDGDFQDMFEPVGDTDVR